jgi:small subunit ribosomal protein S3
VDYGFFEAKTTFGRIGVKVWIYKGDVKNIAEVRAENAAARAGNRPSRGGGSDRPRRGGERGGRGRKPQQAQQSEAPKTEAGAAAAPAAEAAPSTGGTEA